MKLDDDNDNNVVDSDVDVEVNDVLHSSNTPNFRKYFHSCLIFIYFLG